MKKRTRDHTQQRVCPTCGKEFTAHKCYTKKGHRVFCSQKCHIEESKVDTEATLRLWNEGLSLTAITKKLGSNRKKTRKWLSEQGIYEYRFPRGSRSGAHFYRSIAFAAYPRCCSVCGYDRVVGVLEVHHVDGNRHNNSIENLIPLCPTCHEERHYHEKTSKYGPHRPADKT